MCMHTYHNFVYMHMYTGDCWGAMHQRQWRRPVRGMWRWLSQVSHPSLCVCCFIFACMCGPYLYAYTELNWLQISPGGEKTEGCTKACLQCCTKACLQCCTKECLQCCTKECLQCCTKACLQCCTKACLQCCTKECLQCLPIAGQIVEIMWACVHVQGHDIATGRLHRGQLRQMRNAEARPHSARSDLDTRLEGPCEHMSVLRSWFVFHACWTAADVMHTSCAKCISLCFLYAYLCECVCLHTQIHICYLYAMKSVDKFIGLPDEKLGMSQVGVCA